MELKQYTSMCGAVSLAWLYREESDLDLPYTEVSLLLRYSVALLCSKSDLSRQRTLMISKVTNVHWRNFTGILTFKNFVILSSCVNCRTFFASVVCVAVIATVRDTTQNARRRHEQGETV